MKTLVHILRDVAKFPFSNASNSIANGEPDPMCLKK